MKHNQKFSLHAKYSNPEISLIVIHFLVFTSVKLIIHDNGRCINHAMTLNFYLILAFTPKNMPNNAITLSPGEAPSKIRCFDIQQVLLLSFPSHIELTLDKYKNKKYRFQSRSHGSFLIKIYTVLYTVLLQNHNRC